MQPDNNLPDYNSLLLQYRSGNLVPVIGSALLKVVSEDGTKMPFERYIIEYYKNQGLLATITVPKSLTELAITRNSFESEMPGIYSAIETQSVDNRPYFDDSLLQLLAQGDQFRYYISTSYDRRMEELLGDDVEVLTWNHLKESSPVVKKVSPKKSLIYLFGKIRKQGEGDEVVSYVDIDKLECLFGLTSSIPQSLPPDEAALLNLLTGKTLLFIGNHFEDWFMRLAIRVLCNLKFNKLQLRKKMVYIINDTSAAIEYEKYFIEKYGIELVHQFPMQDFVETLMTKIVAETKFHDKYEGKQVFISYDRDDKVVAEKINSHLRWRGINSWLDTRSLGIGEYGIEIDDRITSSKTCLVVCLLSEGLANKQSDDSYVKRVEWPIVEKRVKLNAVLKSMKREVEKFEVLPVAVDDFNGYVNKLPEFIPKNTIFSSEDDLLNGYIDKFMRQ